MTGINLLPLSCAISPLPAELMLSFSSRVLCQKRCWRRKGLFLGGSDVFLLACSSRLCSSREPADWETSSFPCLPSFWFGSQQILRSGTPHPTPPLRREWLCQAPRAQVPSKFQREDFQVHRTQHQQNVSVIWWVMAMPFSRRSGSWPRAVGEGN